VPFKRKKTVRKWIMTDKNNKLKTLMKSMCLMQDGVGRGGQVVGGEGRMRECLCCVL
jgi:hypothetical protein